MFKHLYPNMLCNSQIPLKHTCPVARVVQVHSEGVWFVVSLPRWRGAVLIVGVGVVV